MVDTPRPPVVTNPGAQVNAEAKVVNLAIVANDPDGELLSYSAVGLPAGLSIDESTGVISGTIAYDAAEISNGVYTTVVTASDPEGRTDSQSFTWTVSDTLQPLTLDIHTISTTPGTETGAEGDSVLVPVVASDPDASSVTFSAMNLPDGLSIDANTGAIQGVIAYDAAEQSGGMNPPVSGQYTVTVSALDDLGRTTNQNFTWTVSNTYQQPTIADPGPQSNNEGDTVSLALAANDPEGNPLTFSAVGLPAGSSIDAATGIISGSVSYSAAETSTAGNPQGQYTAVVTAVDDAGGSTSLAIAWTIAHVQQPMTVATPSAQTSVEGSTVTLSIMASGPDPGSLTFSASGLPTGVSINASTGVISGTLDPAAAESSQGNYRVTVTTTNNLGQTANASFIWTVTSTGSTPVITNPGTQSGHERDSVSLPITLSNPADDAMVFSATGLPAGLSIDPTSGTITGTIASDAAETTQGSNPPGQYTVTVSADDGQGDATSQTFTWNVVHTALPPTITTPGDQADAEGDSVSLAIAANDPSGDTLTYTARGLPPGLKIDPTTGAISGTIYYSDAEDSSDPSQSLGNYAVEVTAFNNMGGSATVDFNWTISDTLQPPTLVVIDPKTNAEGDSPWLRVVASDAEGSAITFSATGLPGGLSIDANSGLISGTLDYSDAEEGTNNSQPGTYQVTVTATDDLGLATSEQFTWTVTDTQGAPVIQHVGIQHSREGDAVSLAISAASPSGTALTFSATGLPAGLAIDSTTGVISGTVDYSDAETQMGVYNSMVTATDATGAASSASFTWAIIDTPRPPVVTNPGSQTNAEGDTVSLAVTATDPDGYALQYGANGLPVGLKIDVNTGVISGELSYFDSQTLGGNYPVEVVVEDGHGPTTKVDFTWNVTQTLLPPLLGIVTNSATAGIETGAEGDTFWLQVDASDPLDRPLTYTATGLPGGVTIDPVTGLITGTLDYNDAEGTNNSQPGTYSVTVTAANDQGLSTSQTFTWTVADTYRAPSIAAIDSQQSQEGDVVDLALTFSDPEGNAPTFSATGLPGGLSIDPNTGAITGTIEYSAAETQSGIYAVTISATDPNGTAGSQTFQWLVDDRAQPPVVTAPSAQTNAGGDTVSLAVIATDPDGFALEYSATRLPSGLSMNPITGVISGKVDYAAAEQGTNNSQPGTYSVTVTADDGMGNVGNQSFTWTITSTTVAPALDNPGDQLGEAGNTVVLDISATDPAGRPLTYSASGMPAGLSIDATTGVISGTIDSGAAQASGANDPAGVYDVTVAATNDQGQSTIQSFSWTITNTNTAPTASDLAITTFVNSAVTLQLVGQDADDDLLTYQISTQPQHGTVSLVGATAVYTPSAGYTGSDSFGFETSDGQATSSEATVSVSVAALPSLPSGPTTSTATSPASSPSMGAPSSPPPFAGQGGFNWADEMTANAVPLPVLVGVPFGNGAVFLSVPGMPTPTSLTGLVNAASGSAGTAPSKGNYSTSFQGTFTDAAGNSDTTSGANTVKYAVSTSTDSSGNAVLDETMSTNFSFGASSVLPMGGLSGLTESCDFVYTLHKVDAGSTITYTLSEMGSYTLNLNASGSYGVSVQSAAANGGGASGMTMTNSFSLFDRDSVTYNNSDTVVVTFHPDHTKTLTEAFVGTSNSYDTYNHTVGMSTSGTLTSAPGGSMLVDFDNTSHVQGYDSIQGFRVGNAAIDANGQLSGSEQDSVYSVSTDQYAQGSGTSATTSSSTSYAYAPLAMSGGYSNQALSTQSTNSTITGSDRAVYDSAAQTVFGPSGSTVSGNSVLRGGGDDRYADQASGSTVSLYTAPGSSGGASSSNSSDDNGTDEYQFQSFTLVGADQTTTQVSDESGSGSDEYSGYESQGTSSQGASNIVGGSGNSSSSFSMDSVSGNDRYNEASTDSQTTKVVGLATYVNGVASYVSNGSGGDQYVGLASSNDHQEYALPYGTVWTTDNSHLGTDSGNDSYKFNSQGTIQTNNAATSTSENTDTESGTGSDTYFSLDGHRMGWVANSPGTTSKLTDTSDGESSGHDQYQYVADDGGTSSSNGMWSRYTDGSTQSQGDDIYSATDSLDYTLTGTSLSNNPNGGPTFSGQPVPAAIAAGGSIYQIDNSSLSTIQGNDQYSTNDANHFDQNSDGSQSTTSTSDTSSTGSDVYTQDDKQSTTSDTFSLGGQSVGTLAWGIPSSPVSGWGMAVSSVDTSTDHLEGTDSYFSREVRLSSSGTVSPQSNETIDQASGSGSDVYHGDTLHSYDTMLVGFSSQPVSQLFYGVKSNVLDASVENGQDTYDSNSSSDQLTTNGNTTLASSAKEIDQGSDTYISIEFLSSQAQNILVWIPSPTSIQDTSSFNHQLSVVSGDDQYVSTSTSLGTTAGTTSTTSNLGTGSDDYHSFGTWGTEYHTASPYSGPLGGSGGGTNSGSSTDLTQSGTTLALGTDSYKDIDKTKTSTDPASPVSYSTSSAETDASSANYWSSGARSYDSKWWVNLTASGGPSISSENRTKDTSFDDGTTSGIAQNNNQTTTSSKNGWSASSDAFSSGVGHDDAVADGTRHNSLAVSSPGGSSSFSEDDSSHGTQTTDGNSLSANWSDSSSSSATSGSDSSNVVHDKYAQQQDQTSKSKITGPNSNSEWTQTQKLGIDGSDDSDAGTFSVSTSGSSPYGTGPGVNLSFSDGSGDDEYSSSVSAIASGYMFGPTSGFISESKNVSTTTGKDHAEGSLSTTNLTAPNGAITYSNTSSGEGNGEFDTVAGGESSLAQWGQKYLGGQAGMVNFFDLTINTGNSKVDGVTSESSGGLTSGSLPYAGGILQTYLNLHSDLAHSDYTTKGSQVLTQIELLQSGGQSSSTVEITNASGTEHDVIDGGDVTGSSGGAGGMMPLGSGASSSGVMSQFADSQSDSTASLTDTEFGSGKSGTANSTSYRRLVTSGGASETASADKTMSYGMGTGAPLMLTAIDASDVVSSNDKYTYQEASTFKDNVTKTNAWSSISSKDDARSRYQENGNDAFDGDYTSSMSYGAKSVTNGLNKSDAGHADAFQMRGYTSDETTTQFTMGLFGTSDRWSKDVETAGRDGSHENDAQVTSTTNANGTTTTKNTVADTKGVYWDYKWHKETFEITSPRSFSEGNGHTNSTFLGKDSDHIVNGVNTFEETQFKITSYGHHSDGWSIMPPSWYLHDDNGWTLLDYAGAGTQTNGIDNFTYYNEIEQTHDWSHDVSWSPGSFYESMSESDTSVTTVGSGTTATQTASSNTTVTTDGIPLSWSSGPTVTTISLFDEPLTPLSQFNPYDYWTNVWDTLVGFFIDGPINLVKGIWNLGVGLITFGANVWNDPAGTLGATANSLTLENLSNVWTGIVQHYSDLSQTNRGMGAIAFDIVTMILPGPSLGNLGKLRGGAQLSHAGEVATHARGASVLADVAGGARMLNRFEQAANAARTGDAVNFTKAAGNAVDGAAGKIGRNGSDIFDASTKQLKVLQKNCFAPGTPVLTPKGTRAIETLRPGDLVLSRPEDDVTADVAAHTVGALFELSARIWEVHVGGKLIETTAEHPFFVSGEGWTTANRLQSGDALVGHNEVLTQVEKVVDTGRTATVYNLRVEENHTYFVGDLLWGFSVWVHNANCQPITGRPQHGDAWHDPTGTSSATALEVIHGKGNVRWNQGLVDPHGVSVPGKRPDIQYISGGQVHIIELQSPGQSANFMNNMLGVYQSLLGRYFGSYGWLPHP